jgi:peptide/nickel transport system permease protein
MISEGNSHVLRTLEAWLLPKSEVRMKGYRRYFGKKLIWFAITFVCAVILNFVLPRLMPGDPVPGITGRAVSALTGHSGVHHIY